MAGPEMTTPYAWYQYFINTADADVIRYLRWFTFLSADELADLEEATASRPQERSRSARLPENSPRWYTARRPPRPSSTPAGPCSAAGTGAARRSDAGGGAAGNPVAELKPAPPTGSSICWWPAVCRPARAPRGERSPKAASRSTTPRSTARSGRRGQRTSCTAVAGVAAGQAKYRRHRTRRVNRSRRGLAPGGEWEQSAPCRR
ncbi:tyrosyl-tRNA synthetase [Mycobacterium xenopi 4042]|uniref:Tyrosyl-tRNA synthetase n=1 Tax=Mycobacterium xenopi 4042 TaxID=1299334 RepID=X8DDH3_MYCXE|nr:tyrosyl-tRNA synthetase [Mycobacterium xenopi 4042]